MRSGAIRSIPGKLRLMAALLRFNLERKGFKSLLDTIDAAQIVVERPTGGKRGIEIEKVLRGGVRKQFEAGGIPAWVKAKPFGNKQPAPVTLGGPSGRVAMAWERAPVEKGNREVRLRVTDKIALAHHRGALIKPKQHPSKMQLALGLGSGVWISQERLLLGLRIPKRPVLFTDEMVLGSKLVLFADFQGTG